MKGVHGGVPVSLEVFEGLEAVRRSGRTNMLDRPRVAQLALELGHVDACDWVREHPKDYARAIFDGFVVGGVAP